MSRLLRADGQEFAADAGHDTRHAQRRTLPRQPRRRSHADAATQTQTRRADTRTQTRRRAPRTKQGTTARCGSVPASFATASLATYMPWYCPPRLLDLQLPRRRQTSSDVDFRDGVHGSSLCQFRRVQVVCAREAHTVRSVCGAVPTRGATWRYQQPGVHACVPCTVTSRASPVRASPRHRHQPRVTSRASPAARHRRQPARHP